MSKRVMAASTRRASSITVQPPPATAATVLLHGTRPEFLYNILFEGLNPSVAANGLFGRGTYFAEDAGKIDQYSRKLV